MGRFSGVGGNLYSLGERFSFSDLYLQSEDGWDWVPPIEFSYWLEQPIIVAVNHGERIVTTPAEIYLESGWVGMPRNMSHGYVLASGVCRPISCIGKSERWQLEVKTVTSNITSLGNEHLNTKTKVVGNTLLMQDFSEEVPIGEVLVRLPIASGMFIGVGHADGSSVVTLEGVKYVPRKIG